jgi:hypothetical protein
MKLPILLVLPALLLYTGSQAQAEINWQANWKPGSLALIVGPSSVIDVTNLHNASYETPSGTQVRTPVSNLWIITTATPQHPNGFVNEHYSFGLVIKDTRSGLSHDFKFTGTLSGVISTAGSYIKNVFGPKATQTFTFADGDKYTVKLNGFTMPNTIHGIPSMGSFSAQITAMAPPPPPHVNTIMAGAAHFFGAADVPQGTPEPSTLALGGLGSVFTGLLAWRRRNRRV